MFLLIFGISISVGSVANSYPPCSSSKSLLMADIRCLPGASNYLKNSTFSSDSWSLI